MRSPPAPSTLPLRDIHLPESIGWWPPAPGWWFLPALLLLCLAAVWYVRLLYQRRRYAAVNMAKRELARIRSRYAADGDAAHCVRSVSALLRRVSISVFPRAQSAGLTGREWLAFLQSGSGNAALVRHTGAGLSGIQARGSEPASLMQSSEAGKHHWAERIPEHTCKLLIEAPYRRKVAAAEVEALIDFCSDWMDGLSRSKP